MTYDQLTLDERYTISKLRMAGLYLELGGGLGVYTPRIAVALAVFALVPAAIFHANFADPMQAINFWKNLAIAGGFPMLAANGPGALSRDARFGRGRVLPTRTASP